MKNNLVVNSIKNVMKSNIGLSAGLIIAITGVVILGLLPPQILKYMIDHNFTDKTRDGLLNTAIIYLCVILFIGIFDFMKEAILTVLGQKITKEIRSEMMVKLEHMNSMYFSVNETGMVVSRFTNDVDAINSMFTGGIIGMLVDCFRVFGIVISVWIFRARLGLLTVMLLPLIYLITRLFQKRMLNAQIQNRIMVGRINNHISESLKNIQMIKSYSKERYMEQIYNNFLEKNYETVEKVNFYDSIFSPIIIIIRTVIIAVIVILSSNQFNYFGISLGMVAATIDLISGLFTPIENLGMELQNIQQAVSGIHRVNDFYHETEEDTVSSKDDLESTVFDRDNVQIQFDHVSFYYEEGIDILKNINLSIKPYENVTFAGRTGVGKSTLFKLILGLLKPLEGCITINGQDVCQIPNSIKRKLFGYVDQNLSFIKGTIAEQVSLKDQSITREQIEAALDFVGLKEYVLSLEAGLDTQVINNTLFSQGQKQLLAIARAIVVNPPILLLDEITANLDSITEDKIVSVLQKASHAYTILTISHRLSSMIACDTVVILENGSIKDMGTPEILLTRNEWYRNQTELEKLTRDEKQIRH